MRTRRDEGAYLSPTRLMEMLEFRFGAFEAIAYATLELARRTRTTSCRWTSGPLMQSSSSATIYGMHRALRLRGLWIGRGATRHHFVSETVLETLASMGNAYVIG
jgi:hypothetical protein